MKLHLPKQLFTALLTAITISAPCAVYGLEISGIGEEKTTITLNANQSYRGAAFEYTVDANGVGTSSSLTTKSNSEIENDYVQLTFTLKHTAFDNVVCDQNQDSAKIIWVTNTGSTTWGMAAHNADTDARFEMRGLWGAGEWSSDTTVIDITDDELTTYTIKVGECGTFLDKGDTISNNPIYNKSGLKASGTDRRLTSVSLNSSFIETFNVEEYTNLSFSTETWSKTYNVTQLNNAVASVLTVDRNNVEKIRNANYDIIAGGNGQLKIIAEAAGSIALGNTVYLAEAATSGIASISINNAGAVELSGLLYLVENASIASTGAGDITISGKVTDKNVPSDTESKTANGAYTLSLSGTGYNFTDAVDVTGIHLAEGAEATFHNLTVSGTATIAANTTLTLGGGTDGENVITHSIGTLTASSATVKLGANSALNLESATHNIGIISAGSATVTLGAKGSLTLGTGDHTISSLTLNSASVVETAFGSTGKSVTVDSLTVANGASATLGTQQSNTHNGYFNIKQLKGNGSTLILSNGSKTSLSSVFDLGENQGAATFSGTLILQSNYENADANRGLVLNICNSDVLANTVLELKGTSASGIKERVGIGLNQDTTIGGIKDNADNAPSGSYIQSGIFENSYNFNTVPASSTSDKTVTLTIATNQDYSTSANILDKVNLQKTGTGAQTFSGDMSKFNGDISVIGGTLKFTNRDGFSTNKVTVSNGAELALGGETEIGLLTASSSIVTLEAGAAVTLEGGAEAKVAHTVGTLNANGGSLTIEDNASIEIGSVTANRTLVINKGDTESSVTIGSVTLGENFILDSTEEASYVYISSITDTTGNETQSGYLASSGKLLLIQGYEWTGNFDGYTVSAEDGNTYLTTSTYSAVGTTYYVNGKDIVTVGRREEATAGVEAATAFEVAAGATLNIAELPAGWTAKELLSGKVTGEGTLLISKSGLSTGGVDLATTFSGTLELAAGGAENSPNVFTFGATNAGSDGKTINTSSISGFVLNDKSKLQYQGSGSEFKNVTVNGSAEFYIIDGNNSSDASAVKLTGNTTLNAGATLTLNALWGARYNINNLTGAGNLKAQGASQDEDFYTTIKGLDGFTGSLTFTDITRHYVDVYTGTKAESVSFAKLFFAGSGKENFHVQTNTQVATLSAAGGTVDIAKDKILTLGGGSSETPANHSIGTLSAATGFISLEQYAVLTLGNGEVASTHNIGTLNAEEGAVITLNTGATLNAFTKGTGTVTLKGSGIYNLGSNATSNVSGLDQATWTGTVKINDTKLSIADLSTFGNANSTISVSKIQGDLPTQATEQTIQSHIILEPVLNASCFDLDGDSAANLTFTGKISGSGNMGTAQDSAAGHKITFAGDVTDWTGIYWASQASTITYSDNAKVINNEITAGEGKTSTVLYKNTTGMIVNGNINNQEWTKGTLNLQILNENNATGKVVFNGAVVKGTTNLTVEENASAEFTNASVNLNTVDVKEGAEISFATLNAQSVTNSGALNLGTAATITKAAEGTTAATMTKVQMSSAGISSAATDSTKGSISNALIDLQKAAEFSISDMSLSNVSFKAAATGTELNLNNVTAEAVQLAAGQFTLGGEVALSEQTPATKSGGYTASFTTDQLNGITLNNASGAASLTVDLGELPDCLQDGKTYNITIALIGFSMAAYDGTGLLFAADSWLGKLLADQGASQYVSSGDVESATTLAANNNTVTVTYTAMPDGNVGTIITITGLTIPEPTTSTLGLVALAALVTRRRRK